MEQLVCPRDLLVSIVDVLPNSVYVLALHLHLARDLLLQNRNVLQRVHDLGELVVPRLLNRQLLIQFHRLERGLVYLLVLVEVQRVNRRVLRQLEIVFVGLFLPDFLLVELVQRLYMFEQYLFLLFVNDVLDGVTRRLCCELLVGLVDYRLDLG